MGRIGCYTLDLYCDDPNHVYEFPATMDQFTGRTEAECIRNANRCGWIVSKTKQGDLGCGYAVCPKCMERRLSDE